MKLRKAKPLEVAQWMNTQEPITLEALRDKVVLVKAFQMLCPGCVSHALPQAMRVRRLFAETDVAVIGLHTVFEHHEAQGTDEALKAFLHEYQITFPVGVDKPSAGGGLPKTMAAYQMQGTPTTILIDRNGLVRKQKFGAEEDLTLGAEIMALLREGAQPTQRDSNSTGQDCSEEGCAID